MSSDIMQARRAGLVEHLRQRGITHGGVLGAINTVPRECFVPRRFRRAAYRDKPLPIGGGQTISQPYIVALMVSAAQVSGGRVLEIGTGSGYGAAILSRIAGQVYTVERRGRHARRARCRLMRLGYRNIFVRWGDGTLGWRTHAPYQAIVVTAAGPRVPRALLRQLAIGGRLVIPVGSRVGARRNPALIARKLLAQRSLRRRRRRSGQRLIRITRLSDKEYRREVISSVAFVPLIGAQGWR